MKCRSEKRMTYAVYVDEFVEILHIISIILCNKQDEIFANTNIILVTSR